MGENPRLVAIESFSTGVFGYMFSLRTGSCLLLAAVLWVAFLAISRGHLVLFASSVVVLFLSGWYFHKALNVFDLRRPTIPAFWFFSYLSMNWFPAILIFLRVTPHDYAYRIYAGHHLHTFLYAAFSVLFTVPIGIWLTNCILRFNRDEIRRFFEAPVRASPARVGPFFLLTFLAIAMTLVYFSELKVIPLVEMIKNPGNFASLAFLREESFVDLDSRFVYAYSVLREALYPFLIATAFGNYICTRRRIWLFLFVTTLLVGLAYASVSIARGPVATILMVLVGLWYVLRSTRVTVRQAAIGVGLVLSFPVFVTIWMREAGMSAFDLLKLLGTRLFYLPSYVAHVYFEVVPKEVHFLHGATSETFARLLGMRHFDMTRYVIFTIYPNAPDSAGAGGAFFADAYANFGLPGVLVSGVLLGFIVQTMQIIILRREKTAMSLSVLAFMFYAFWMTTSRALQTVLLSTGVSFVLILWWFLSRFGELRAPQIARATLNELSS